VEPADQAYESARIILLHPTAKSPNIQNGARGYGKINMGGKRNGKTNPANSFAVFSRASLQTPPIRSVLYALYCIKYSEWNINLVSSSTYYIHHKHTAFNGDAIYQKCTVGGDKSFHLLPYLFHW
jgi:hypothetical protein